MIDFRYHVVSLISVFLAVALGIVIGTTQLNGAVVDGLRGQVTSLAADKRDLETRSSNLEAQLNTGDAFGDAVAPVLVANALPGARVLIVVASDAVDRDVQDKVTTLLQGAGATISGVLELRSDYSDPQRASDLQSYATGEGLPPGITLPETENAGELVGALLADVIMAPADGAEAAAQTSIQTVLSGLSSLDVLALQSPQVTTSDYAVILTAERLVGDDADDRNAALADLAAALDSAGKGSVVAGDVASSTDKGLVGVIRADPTLATGVSTVDNVNVAAGRISTVLACKDEGQGTSGKYGTGKDTQPVPPLG